MNESLVSGFIGAVVGAFSAHLLDLIKEKKSKKAELTIEMFEEWNRILELRFFVPQFIKKEKINSFQKFESLRNDKQEDFIKTSKILLFVHKYALFYNEGFLDKKIDKKTMRPYLLWWYSSWFQELLEETGSGISEWNDWKIEIKKYFRGN